MRRETMQNKLADLLGLDQFKVETKPKSKKGSSHEPKFVGISEDRIQEFRAAQGLSYFLQAPELFTLKKCPHCSEEFLVSRPFVAFCSYTCIKKDLESKGLPFSKGLDLETLAKEVYEGNEPIWIKNIQRIRHVLLETPSESLLSRPNTSSPALSSSSV